MIPIHAPSWEGSKDWELPPFLQLLTALPTMQKKVLQTVAFLTAGLLLSGCTNSKLIIGPLYNRMDDQMRAEFNKLGNFNNAQVDAFEQSIGTFHVWHRQSEMPKYAELLSNIAHSIGEKNATNQTDVDGWTANIEQLSMNYRECHPVNYSIDLIQSLTDDQIDFIERRFNSERERNKNRYAEQTQEERIERRLKNMVKWSGRLGLHLTTDQKKILRDSLTQQTSMRKEYYQLSTEWNQHLFLLARNQENPSYKKALSSHLTKFWTLLEQAHPKQWRSIRDLWRTTIHTLIGTFSESQRTVTKQWLRKMAKTIKAISKDKPSFKVTNDASIGCLVSQNN